ncbi:MAG: tRNA epoxyqueuosine(34) reductase QueG [Anaerolineaceae bacterium]|nr:tRNA epoxyqueuosine(34) reductase QueG [Anaerolineaceae bacterium]
MRNKDKIKAEAKRLGFSLCGFSKPNPPDHFFVYQDWLNNDYHGNMQYLNSDRAVFMRADPVRLFPETLTIISLGYPYSSYSIDQIQNIDNKYGVISAYALSNDYHDILKKKAKSLLLFLEKETKKAFPYKIYIDTGPILEKEIASLAGLGWIGKNSSLISPEFGSTFFLAEILIGLEFEPDQRFENNFCGNCTKCIDACPTNCIQNNRTIDASQCISYLTIENKGIIPYEFRSKMKNWVFGCDICQMVCPWNQKHSKNISSFQNNHSPIPAIVNLFDEILISNQVFKDKYKATPILRTKRKGYLRNIAIALGNCQDEGAVPILIKALEREEDPIIQAHIVWALGQLLNDEVKEFLFDYSKKEQNEIVLAEINKII